MLHYIFFLINSVFINKNSQTILHPRHRSHLTLGFWFVYLSRLAAGRRTSDRSDRNAFASWPIPPRVTTKRPIATSNPSKDCCIVEVTEPVNPNHAQTIAPIGSPTLPEQDLIRSGDATQESRSIPFKIDFNVTIVPKPKAKKMRPQLE